MNKQGKQLEAFVKMVEETFVPEGFIVTVRD
jgi:hypothetical protein